MKRTAVTLLLLFLSLPSLAERRRAATPPTEDGLSFEQWIAHRAIPFNTVEPGTDDSDLLPLIAVVGDKQYVGVGEATHGTHEFFAMKARMFRFLAEHMGFTVFAMEGNLPECDAINDYVQTGNGNLQALIAGMHFWTWEADELADLVVWMRAYNIAHPGRPRLSFRGFDMQYSQAAIVALDAYLSRVDPANANAIAADFGCANSTLDVYLKLTPSQRDACQTSLRSGFDAVESARDAYTAASSAAEYERMLRYARIAVQWEDDVGHEDVFNDVRDGYMAENAEWIAEVEHPGEKMMMWAHNGHIGREMPEQMGSWLHLHWPTKHIGIGFMFDHGDFYARDAKTFVLETWHVDPATDRGYEPLFRTAGLPRFILDLRNPPSSVQPDLIKNKTMYDIGSNYPAPRYLEAIGLQFDVVIWIAESTPSHLFPGVVR